MNSIFQIKIRNMVSHRCVTMVKNELDKLNIIYKNVDLGKVQLLNKITNLQLNLLKTVLGDAGLEIMTSSNDVLVSKIKEAVQQWILLPDSLPEESCTNYLRRTLNSDSTYLSHIFSIQEGITLERYIIIQKIEHVKQLLASNKLSISDISLKMHYSSIAHLCNQFKQYTGFTPVEFKHTAT